jgi:hypothetical protein
MIIDLNVVVVVVVFDVRVGLDGDDRLEFAGDGLADEDDPGGLGPVQVAVAPDAPGEQGVAVAVDFEDRADDTPDGLHLVTDGVPGTLIGPGRPGLGLLRLEEEEVAAHGDDDQDDEREHAAARFLRTGRRDHVEQGEKMRHMRSFSRVGMRRGHPIACLSAFRDALGTFHLGPLPAIPVRRPLARRREPDLAGRLPTVPGPPPSPPGRRNSRHGRLWRNFSRAT